MKRFSRIALMMGILFFAGCSSKISSLDYNPTDLHPRIVSYEYLTTCPKCGDDKMEGYYSIVDGYRQENCKSCWYLSVTEANSEK